MFDKEKEGKFNSERTSIGRVLLGESVEVNDATSARCTLAEDVKKTVRASFQFIKDNPEFDKGQLLYAHLTLKVFLLKDVESTSNNFAYAITEISGAVKEVYESYVVLKAKNSDNEEFEVNVVYEDIVYFYHYTIYKNFESYVNFINSIPPLCRDLKSESYNLLVRLAKILGKNNPDEREFVFILGKAVTRSFRASDISIIRNLVVTEEFFVNPITSIQGFSQIPNIG